MAGLVACLGGKDAGFEFLQQLLAPPNPIEGFFAARGAEPVTLYLTRIPAPDLVQVLAHLLCFGIAEVLPEYFELDLFGEVHLAVLDNLPILHIALLEEAVD